MKVNDAIYHLNTQVQHIDINGVAYDAAGNQVAYDQAAVQACVQANAYKDLRANEYPSIPEQFDLLYHGGYDAWKSVIQEVKDKYPKGQA
jgi:hypothetical protein